MDQVRLPKQTVPRSDRPLDAQHPGRQTARDLIPFAILYVSLFAAFGALSPFLPAFLNSRQLRSDEIGFALGTASAVRLIAGPVAGAAADRMQRARTVFAVCSIGAAIFALSNIALTTFWPLFAATVLWSASIAPAAPLTDALALAAAKPRRGNKGFEYGWVRGAGSAAFVLGTIGTGQLVGPLGPGAALALQACLLVFAATWISRVPNYLATTHSQNAAEHDSIFELLRLPAFRQVIMIAGLVLGSHALHDSFAVIYWNAAGISPAVVSILWSEQVVAEVFVFLLIGPVLLRWIGPAWALTVSAAIGAIRWALGAASTDPYVWACIEPLHGATFALLHLASMRIIAEVTPARLAATAQSLYGNLGIGVAVTVLTFASGVLYQHLGGRAFWVMSGLCVTAIPIAMRLQVRE